MELQTNKKDLQKVLTTAYKAIAAKPSFPMMENFLLTIDDDALRVIATDGSITVESSTNATCTDAGSTCINAKLLLDSVALMPDDDIIVASGENIATIKYKGGQFTVPCFPTEDYPDVNTVIMGPTSSMVCSDLKDALGFVAPSVAKDQLRPVLCGVYFNPKDGTYDIVTSDAHTLSLQTVPFTADTLEPFVLPSSASRFLASQLPDDDTAVLFSEDDAHVSFAFGNTIINAVKVVGKFPNYEMVIPKDNESKLTANVADLLATVKRVSTCANKASNAIKFSLSTLGGATIEAQDIGFGCSARETMDGVTYNGQEMEIGFKHDLLTALLSVLTETDVVVSLDSPKRAVLLTTNNESRKQVIVPVATVVMGN